MKLAYTLQAEAVENPSKWVAYQLLDSPVMVACRVTGTGYEMRIARPDRENGEVWLRTLAQMEKFLGLDGWKKESDAQAKGFAMRYTGRPGDAP